MNNTIITMMKKELARFFGDSRMVITTIFLPGCMIFLLYSVMGSALKTQYSTDTFSPKCQVINLPASWKEPLEKLGYDWEEMTDSAENIEKAKRALEEKKCELLIIFPADFLQMVEAYDNTSTQATPQVEIYYNSTYTASVTAYDAFTAYLDQYESTLVNKFDINATTGETYDVATEEDTTARLFSSMLPFLLLTFLYSGCVSVAPESIAGEKERGTMAALLITPVKRSHIALGKIAALSLIALLSGISSAVGTLLSIPNLMGDSAWISQGVYGAPEYVALGVIIISTALVLVTFISMISAFAKSIKEAQTYVTPLMILVMLVGLTAMFGEEAKQSLVYYLIPLYNSVQAMVGIFSFQISLPQILTTIASNLCLTALGAFALAKMFDSEYIMFHK